MSVIKKPLVCFVVAVVAVMLSACVAQQQPQPKSTNPFTSGEVTLVLKKGVTTKSQGIKAFGAPDIVTQKDNGTSEFVYQKNMQLRQSSSSSSYITVLLLGANRDSSSDEQSSKTMTLIINFNKHDVVKSYRSMTTSF